MLLFLKHVTTLEVFTWPPGATDPQPEFSCTLLDADDPSLQRARARFVQAASAMAAGEAAMAAQLGLGVSLHHQAFAMQAAGSEARIEQFLVAQSAGDTQAAAMARHVSTQLGTRVLPWGAVAARMGTPAGSSCTAWRRGRCGLQSVYELAVHASIQYLNPTIQYIHTCYNTPATCASLHRGFCVLLPAAASSDRAAGACQWVL